VVVRSDGPRPERRNHRRADGSGGRRWDGGMLMMEKEALMCVHDRKCACARASKHARTNYNQLYQ
jgi:hypothetical protein